LNCLANSLIEALKVDSCSNLFGKLRSTALFISGDPRLGKSRDCQVTIGFSEGLIGFIGQREEPINLSDAPSHPRFKYYAEVQEDHFHAFLGAPNYSSA